MPKFKSDFLRVLDERGFIHQISDEAGLDRLFATETVTAYVGYDATATSLHIGNLITATMLHWLQATGHRPITLMGGGTSMIGDPSFRDEQRKPAEALAAFQQARQCYDLSIALRREAIARIEAGPGTETAKARESARHRRELADLQSRRDEAERAITLLDGSKSVP